MSTNAINALQHLTEADIKNRLAEVEGERQALMTLLRAVRSRDRAHATWSGSKVCKTRPATAEGDG